MLHNLKGSINIDVVLEPTTEHFFIQRAANNINELWASEHKRKYWSHKTHTITVAALSQRRHSSQFTPGPMERSGCKPFSHPWHVVAATVHPKAACRQPTGMENPSIRKLLLNTVNSHDTTRATAKLDTNRRRRRRRRENSFEPREIPTPARSSSAVRWSPQ